MDKYKIHNYLNYVKYTQGGSNACFYESDDGKRYLWIKNKVFSDEIKELIYSKTRDITFVLTSFDIYIISGGPIVYRISAMGTTIDKLRTQEALQRN